MIAEITPIGKPRMTRNGLWDKRARAYYQYKQALHLLFPGYELPEVLEISFVLPMPKSWSGKKKRQMFGQPHQSKPDIDNLVKGFTDALATREKGDQHIHTIRADKKWGESGYIRTYDKRFLQEDKADGR